MTLEAKEVAYAVRGTKVLNGVSAEFRPGQFYGIIGPNGAGKTTLLQLLAGTWKPDDGEVLLEGRPVTAISRKRLARRMAVLQQGGLPPVGFTVREVAEMGRFPHRNWLGAETEDSGPIIEHALDAMGLAALQHRRLNQLSGGERQRAALAKLMVQQPDILLLDEPTTYLDIGYQLGLLDTVRDWQRREGLTVIAVLHDLNLAALYCDRLLALHDGKDAAFGSPQEVLTPELVRTLYGTTPAVIPHPETGAPQVMLLPGERS